MPASNYFANAVANVLRGTTLNGIATVYVGLFDDDPGPAGTDATEVTTSVRAAGRVAVTFGAPTDGDMANTGIVDFGESDGAATLGGWALFDAASGGNMIAHVSIPSRSIVAGEPVSFPVGALTYAAD
jgi:hypothetical protein